MLYVFIILLYWFIIINQNYHLQWIIFLTKIKKKKFIRWDKIYNINVLNLRKKKFIRWNKIYNINVLNLRKKNFIRWDKIYNINVLNLRKKKKKIFFLWSQWLFDILLVRNLGKEVAFSIRLNRLKSSSNTNKFHCYGSID